MNFEKEMKMYMPILKRFLISVIVLFACRVVCADDRIVLDNKVPKKLVKDLKSDDIKILKAAIDAFSKMGEIDAEIQLEVIKSFLTNSNLNLNSIKLILANGKIVQARAFSKLYEAVNKPWNYVER
jgi:hypothetical protein